MHVAIAYSIELTQTDTRRKTKRIVYDVQTFDDELSAERHLMSMNYDKQVICKIIKTSAESLLKDIQKCISKSVASYYRTKVYLSDPMHRAKRRKLTDEQKKRQAIAMRQWRLKYPERYREQQHRAYLRRKAKKSI